MENSPAHQQNASTLVPGNKQDDMQDVTQTYATHVGIFIIYFEPPGELNFLFDFN